MVCLRDSKPLSIRAVNAGDDGCDVVVHCDDMDTCGEVIQDMTKALGLGRDDLSNFVKNKFRSGVTLAKTEAKLRDFFEAHREVLASGGAIDGLPPPRAISKPQAARKPRKPAAAAPPNAAAASATDAAARAEPAAATKSAKAAAAADGILAGEVDLPQLIKLVGGVQPAQTLSTMGSAGQGRDGAISSKESSASDEA